jgi:SAM-dependent methyltransferase
MEPLKEHRGSFLEGETMTIARALLSLADNSTVQRELPGIGDHAARLVEAVKGKDPVSAESAMIRLYLTLHGAGSGYTPVERERLNGKKGYSCISGGLSPLVKARLHIRTESTVADLGAGNGLQGLLLQRLYPHKKTLQIEISSEMIRVGRIFQNALGISDDRVSWVNDDIVNVALESVDFVYIYRPSRPSGSGRDLYRAIALKLAAVPKPLVVFSIADCLSEFLDERFSILCTDGHLTCFRKE